MARYFVKRNIPKHNCSFEGCERTATAKSRTNKAPLCAKHYTREWRESGSARVNHTGTALERFHNKYAINETTGCWEWVCYVHPRGYGLFSISGRRGLRAHRFSYENLVGHIPDGFMVLHKCDNRRCVNPAHLFLGTAKDNSDDMFKKGRAPKRGVIKITWPMATNIRVMYARGSSIEFLAGIYGVSDDSIARIVKGRGHLRPISKT